VPRFNVIISAAPKADIADALKYYDEISHALADRFLEDLVQVYEALKLRPHVHAARYKDVRVALLENFPYGVHYTINEVVNTVEVIAVFHVSMDPSKWYKR